MSQIPAYGIVDPETGERHLSRNRRFDHKWYSSKKLDFYDNHNTGDYATSTSPVENEKMLKMFFIHLDGAIQTL